MSKKNNEITLRDHVYDGIQEYDQRLPRWWLITLYGSIIFAVCYWVAYQQTGYGKTNVEILAQQQREIEAEKLAQSMNALDDATLWAMSQNPDFVAAGKKAYDSNCVACHGANLEGGIGFNLKDSEWIHGGSPTEIYHTLEVGVLEKGMPAWVPILGSKGSAEVVAYLLSYQEAPASE